MPKYTFVADGEPSFYGVYKDGNWFAKIQFNGEITVAHEEVFLAMMANTAATLDAMKSLIGDIDSMQSETQPNWFGPFGVYEDAGSFGEDQVEIEWPNLAISVENLQKAIFNLNTDRQIEGELTKQVLISGKKAQVILTDDLDAVLKDSK
ncbi:hypothetical protein X766_16055 [Mesorhizobium sp. LSJC255A00]|uniref:hypothetical protein n=1 Tax=Mesorhizobium sp. LSJC255A00 TaxID=1287313 RepID=UPI0003CDF02F|nr:hypothetical protein [Mesorhizobium sp. LSJC255A00]ESX17901.1 hypothetical protein X766_16055 [Mesorhizobium sp. LSJC255A00]